MARVAILGATGAVGRTMLEVLEERNLPIDELVLLASERSAGTKVQFKGEELTVQAVSADSFDGIDVAIFSAGATRSREWAPVAVAAGATVVDNSSAFRMQADVPLVVADVKLALHHALVKPSGAEDQAAQPMNQRAVGGADELRPAVVYVLAEV